VSTNSGEQRGTPTSRALLRLPSTTASTVSSGGEGKNEEEVRDTWDKEGVRLWEEEEICLQFIEEEERETPRRRRNDDLQSH
jgi:predicted oxidoreductase